MEESYTITLDDDPMVPKIIEKSTGIPSRHFASPGPLMDKVGELQPIAIFVDINLGEPTSGLDCIPTLRKAWPFCPIIVITSETTEEAIMRSLNVGADDFVQKPIIPAEIKARLNLRLQDSTVKEGKGVIRFGDIELDVQRRTITGPLGKHYASPIEISVLATLAQTEGGILEKEALKVRCWGEMKVTDNALHRKLHAIRQILREVSEHVAIATKYGVGFYLKHEVSSDSDARKVS